MPNNDLASEDVSNSEIDIRKFFLRIISEKKKFTQNAFIAACIWAIAFIIYAFLTYNSSTYYSQVIGLNFPQAAQGKYPNGSQLSASDIISNSVLERVWTKNNLADKSIALPIFQNSFTSIPYSGEVNFIDKKYKDLLATKGLSRPDVEKIESDYKNEIQAASSKNIKLTLDTRGQKYDSALAQKLLNDVAEEWNKTAVEKLGVTKSPVLDGITLNDDIKSSSPYVVLAYLNDSVFRLQTVIALMLREPSSNFYRDSETNLNLSGAASRLQEVSKYEVDELDAFVAINSKPSEWEMLQTQYKLKELQATKIALEQKAETNRRALVDYSTTTSQSISASSVDGRGRGAVGDNSGVQINGDAITKLFSLAAESKDADYRQGITTNRIAIENQASDLSVQIQKIERRISAAGSRNNKFTEETKKEYKALLDKVWQHLGAIIGVVGRIQITAQKDFLGDSGHLFTVISQPSPYSFNGGLYKKALISLFLALLFGSIATLAQIYLPSLFKRGEE